MHRERERERERERQRERGGVGPGAQTPAEKTSSQLKKNSTQCFLVVLFEACGLRCVVIGRPAGDIISSLDSFLVNVGGRKPPDLKQGSYSNNKYLTAKN